MEPVADMSAFGPKRTSLVAPHMSAIGGKADILPTIPLEDPGTARRIGRSSRARASSDNRR